MLNYLIILAGVTFAYFLIKEETVIFFGISYKTY